MVKTPRRGRAKKRRHNPRAPRARPRSELEAWDRVDGYARRISRTTRDAANIQDARDIMTVAAQMMAQVRSKVHANPALAVFGANPKGAPCLSENVQAVLYRHAADGADYVHPFGRGVAVKNKADGSTVVRAAGSARSGVRATLLRNGSVLLWHPTKRLWGEFT